MIQNGKLSHKHDKNPTVIPYQLNAYCNKNNNAIDIHLSVIMVRIVTRVNNNKNTNNNDNDSNNNGCK